MTRSGLLILIPKSLDEATSDFFALATVESFFGFSSTTSLAGIFELAPVPSRQVERPDPPALVAVLPADDDEFLPLDALDLQPVFRPIAAVTRLGFL